jgi:hypothetical protein
MPFSWSEMSQFKPWTWYSRISPLMSAEARRLAQPPCPPPPSARSPTHRKAWPGKRRRSAPPCRAGSAHRPLPFRSCAAAAGWATCPHAHKDQSVPALHARGAARGLTDVVSAAAAPAAAASARFCGESVSAGTLASRSRRLFFAWPVDEDESKKCLGCHARPAQPHESSTRRPAAHRNTRQHSHRDRAWGWSGTY